jgi:glycosyltransferase involved in cell wall biosynthesis
MQGEHRPLVTIITIVYNGEKHLADCIDSVRRQDYAHLQYIIVDGGSTDGTLAVVGRNRDVVTDVISEKDEGISDAFNKGILRAKGEIIGLINTDDWYEDGAVDKAVRAMGEADIVYGDLRYWKDGQPDYIAKGNHLHLHREMTVNHPTVFIKRSCYERFGLFDKQYRCAMDYDLLLRLSVNHCRFQYIPTVLANMRWGGISDNRWMMGVRETCSIKDKYLGHRKWRNSLYFFKQVTAIGLPRLLNRIGLGVLIRLYRASLAKPRKVYER